MLRLTRGETRALLHCSILVALATVGRCTLMRPTGPALETAAIGSAGDIDSALLAAESVRAERERRGQPLREGETIDLNTAPPGELDRLPGVGPVLAGEIARHRAENGPFRSLRDVEQVSGLGSKTLQRIAPLLAPFPPAGERLRTPHRRNPVPELEVKLDLNRASAEELTALPGIGPVKAAAIVRWREEHGRFRSVDQITEVPGIGPATLSRLRPLVVAGP